MPQDEWTIYVRDSGNSAWSVLRVTEDKNLVDWYVIERNSDFDYQRYACSRNTV